MKRLICADSPKPYPAASVSSNDNTWSVMWVTDLITQEELIIPYNHTYTFENHGILFSYVYNKITVEEGELFGSNYLEITEPLTFYTEIEIPPLDVQEELRMEYPEVLV